MLKRFLLCGVLAFSVAGCRTLGSRPTPDVCPEPAPVPATPPVQPLPPGGTLPKGATQIVTGVCQSTGAYLAAGVNLQTKSFTYLVYGDRSTREAFLANAYKSGIPVVVYAAPVKVVRGAGSAVVSSSAVASAPGAQQDDGSTFDPCAAANEIGDTPPPDPKDQGGAVPKQVDTFAQLAWRTAGALDGVSDAAPPATPQPAPGTSVPR